MSGCEIEAITTVTLYKDRDNAITIIPYADTVTLENYDMSTATRVVVNADDVSSTTVGDSFVGDSDVTQAVYWDDTALVDGVAQWRIYAKVGLFTGIVAGEYNLRFTIYDTNHPNGLVLPHLDTPLHVNMVDLP
jgi:hypothetical protein